MGSGKNLYYKTLHLSCKLRLNHSHFVAAYCRVQWLPVNYGSCSFFCSSL